jgi:hypothetical protein
MNVILLAAIFASLASMMMMARYKVGCHETNRSCKMTTLILGGASCVAGAVLIVLIFRAMNGGSEESRI